MLRVNSWSARAIQACALVLAAAGIAGCGNEGVPSGPLANDVRAAKGALTPSGYHAAGAVPLRDRLGNAIAVGSTSPYSPERTCGGCHDTSKITEGYHFQQGRGFSNSQLYVSDGFNPAKPWLLSDGMYGKW